MIRNTRRRGRSGGVVVEMAFVSVICLAFMFAIFEYGRVVMMQQIMENAARAGARAAVVTPTSYILPATATSNINAVVTDQLANLPLVNVTITIYQADDVGNPVNGTIANSPWTSTPFGKNIVVQIDADCPNLFPTGVATGVPKSGQPSVMVNFLPNSSTTTPNAIHLTANSMMRGEAN
jgi:Flp pilus assembly protein TadG